MADVIFEDFSIQVQDTIESNINIALEEAAGELESQVKRRTRVDTGQTKNSFQHKVDEATHTAYIGSNDINAIYEEFGTGEFAINGDGRKGGWYYMNPKARINKDGSLRKGSKAFIFTRGKKPSRAFHKAYTKNKAKIINLIQNKMKGL